MQLPNGTIVAVADGEKLNLFRNTGDEAELKLAALRVGDVDTDTKSGARQSSAANPDASQVEEDGFAAGVVQLLNRQVLSHKAEKVVVVAAPRALGEMRKHYHKELQAALIGEVAKDLTGHSTQDIEKALLAA